MKAFRILAILMILASAALSMESGGDEAGSNNVQAASGSDSISVRFIYMSTPLPTFTASSPLFPDIQPDRINEIMQWVKLAAPVDGTGLTAPLHERSMALNIIQMNGQSIQIRPAWTCTSKLETNGNSSTECRAVQDQVWISQTDRPEFFARSAELFQLVTASYKEWMPDVLPYELPAQLTAGQSFEITGSGWLTEKVAVTILKNGDIVWHAEAQTDHDSFTVTGTLPPEAPAADDHYTIQFKGIPFQELPQFGRSWEADLAVAAK